MRKGQAGAILDALASRHRRNSPERNGCREGLVSVSVKAGRRRNKASSRHGRQAKPSAFADHSATASLKAEVESFWSAGARERRLFCFWQSSFQPKPNGSPLLRAQKPKTNCSLYASSVACATRKTWLLQQKTAHTVCNAWLLRPLAKLLDHEKFDMIYTCGPEVMVKKIFDLTEHRKLPLEASLNG